MLDTLYARWVGAADWVHAHRVTVCAIGAPLVILVLAAINQFVLLGFPYVTAGCGRHHTRARTPCRIEENANHDQAIRF